MAEDSELPLTLVAPLELTQPSAASRPPSLPPVGTGSMVERYLVLELLGEGGMGKVYAAHDPGLNRRVALKFLHARLARSVATEWRARLVREAQAMARLSHPNVVNVYDVGLADDQVFIAMELVDGGSVRRWLGAEPRTWREILAVFLEAGDGLAAAHRAGVVHRDFKPDNVLLGSDGRARVTDFGLARASTEAADTERRTSEPVALSVDPDRSDQLTVAGVFMGTPGYMAVEQYDDGPIDLRTDVFAFCVSLWEALFGEMPFASDDPRTLEAVVRAGKPREPKGVRPVPRWLRRVVEKGLAASPERRYANMGALLAALKADPAKRWKRGASIAALAVAAAAAAYAVHARDGARIRACAAEGDAILSVWNDARRGEMARAFAATGRTYAPGVADAVGRALDAYSSDWRASTTEACTATRARGEQSEAMLELRRTCLDSRREELRALADLVVLPDGAAVEKAGRAARALSPIADCSDVDKLSAQVLPRDPSARAAVRALDAELAAAKVLFDAGKPVKSLERLEGLRDRVAEVAYGPLLARWAYRVGLAERQVDEKAAVADLERAIRLADETRQDALRAEAALAVAKIEGSWAGRSEDAHRWLRLAEGMIARAGNAPELAIQRDVDEGWTYQYEQKWSDAAPLFRRALDRLDSTGLADPDLKAQAESGLATTLGAEGKVTEALARETSAVEEMQRAYGADHPLLTGYLNNLADGQLAAGAYPDALATLTRVLHMAEARVARGELSDHAAVLGWPNQTMGEVLMRLERAVDATAPFERAREIYRAAHGASNADVAYADYELCEAYRRSGRPLDAERVLREAEEIASAQAVPDGVRAGVLLERARIALDRGERPSGIATASRALEMREKQGVPREIAVARVVLARALGATDAKRARELTERARAGFEEAHDVAGGNEASVLLQSLR